MLVIQNGKRVVETKLNGFYVCEKFYKMVSSIGNDTWAEMKKLAIQAIYYQPPVIAESRCHKGCGAKEKHILKGIDLLAEGLGESMPNMTSRKPGKFKGLYYLHPNPK
jgi:hypothetical protein